MLQASEVIRQSWLPCLLCSQQREKHLQNGVFFILRWVARKGGMTHLLGLHLCLYSLWRKLSDDLSQGPTLWIAWDKSHSVPVANQVLTGGARAQQQLYSENSENLVCSHIWRQRSWLLLCPASHLGFKPEGETGGKCLQKNYFPNHTSGLVEGNLPAY